MQILSMDEDSITNSTACTLNDHTGSEVLVQRKRTASQHPDAIKDRKKKWKESGNTRRGKIEFSYTTDEHKMDLFAKIKEAKLKIGGNSGMVSSYNMLNHVLDNFLESHNSRTDNAQMNEVTSEPELPASYQYISKEECSSNKDDLFICHSSAIDNLLSRLKNHDVSCNSPLKATNTEKQRHVMTCEFQCKAKHCIRWASSPHVEGGKYFANVRMAHGLFVSGMLPNQYKRLCKAAGIGILGEKYLGQLQKKYGEVVKTLAQESQEEALLEEIAATLAIEEDYTNSKGIDIMTDARHCWRRNARFSDVVYWRQHTQSASLGDNHQDR